eukprot:12130291-Heterocapsa_arctica.AAC.1
MPNSFLVSDSRDGIWRSFLGVTVSPFGAVVHGFRRPFPPVLASFLGDVRGPSGSDGFELHAEIQELLRGPSRASLEPFLPGFLVALRLVPAVDGLEQALPRVLLLPTKGAEDAKEHADSVNPSLLPGFDVGQLVELPGHAFKPARVAVLAEAVGLPGLCGFLGGELGLAPSALVPSASVLGSCVLG